MNLFFIHEDPGTIESVPCRGCGRPIFWATGRVTGKRMPFDRLDPLITPQSPVWNGAYGVDLNLNHWATCPDAPTFRRRKRP